MEVKHLLSPEERVGVFSWRLYRRYATDHLLPNHARQTVILFNLLCAMGAPPPAPERQSILARAAEVLGGEFEHDFAAAADFLLLALNAEPFEVGTSLTGLGEALISAQRPEGGWSFRRGGYGSIPATSRVLRTLVELCKRAESPGPCLLSNGLVNDLKAALVRGYIWLDHTWGNDLIGKRALPFKGGLVLSLVGDRPILAGYEPAAGLVTDTVRYLCDCQLPTGAWTYLLPGNLESLAVGLSSPIDTGLVVLGLLATIDRLKAGPARRRAAEVLKRAEAFLEISLLPEGCWPSPDSLGLTNALDAGGRALHRLLARRTDLAAARAEGRR